ncbi:MAG: ABC transporter ATP-binding protein, partial [Planctomycetales bacterium]|nr:ABC transporter ATP-binding protein [Planctomycetales bacterium]
MPNVPSTSAHRAGQLHARSLIGGLLAGRCWQLTRLASNSFVGGLAEAAFLVLATRSAFAVADDSRSLELLGGRTIPLTTAVVVALALVLLRVLSASLAVWQSATLTTQVVAQTRVDLSTAFLEATWATQQADRTGKLQELLTTFVNQGTALLNNLTTGVVSGFSLLALLGTAVIVDPIGALAVIGGALILGLALRPLRSIVRARGQESSESGMHFASSLNEVSQLGFEVHVFNLQQQAERHVRGLVARNAHAERRLSFARGLVAPVYTGLAYL